MLKETILREFDSRKEIFNGLSISIESLIHTLLDSESIIPHTVSSRVKKRESLSNKLDKKEKYINLHEVTDVVGIRIITHYSDDVDKIATLLEKEFDIDKENSIDKRKVLDPDRFGYLSLHYVLMLNSERTKLLEYKQFTGIKFEIQIRSILQHTWAEIEHDIGYKSKAEVPRDIRRQFSRLAGLLEIADDEFVKIRSSLETYEEYVEKTILESPEEINIDKISLYNFINTSQLIKTIETEIAELLKCSLVDVQKSDVVRHVKFLDYFSISTIFDLQDLLKKHHKNIIKAIVLMMEKYSPPQSVTAGISIRFLAYCLAAILLDKEEYQDFIDMGRLNDSFKDYLGKLSSDIKL